MESSGYRMDGVEKLIAFSIFVGGFINFLVFYGLYEFLKCILIEEAKTSKESDSNLLGVLTMFVVIILAIIMAAVGIS
jgi:hypothetical protein